MTKSPAPSSQITDAVTHANTWLLNDAPAIALATIYQDTAHALGEAVQNAVTVQQQGSILAQAATTQAVMQILSLDTTVDGAAALHEANGISATPQALAATGATDSAVKTIERVIESATGFELGNAGPWSDAVRSIISTAALALRELQSVSQQANMAVVKQSATAAALVGMIKSPDQLEQYKKILELIREI